MLNTAHLTLCRRKDPSLAVQSPFFAFSQRPFSRINDGFYLSPIWKIYSNAFPYTEKSSHPMGKEVCYGNFSIMITLRPDEMNDIGWRRRLGAAADDRLTVPFQPFLKCLLAFYFFPHVPT